MRCQHSTHVVRVDKFSIDYREDGSERQFYSDLTVLDGTTGQPQSTQHISVNKPLRWGGFPAYVWEVPHPDVIAAVIDELHSIQVVHHATAAVPACLLV